MASASNTNGSPTPSASTKEDVPSDVTTVVAPLGDEHTHTVIFLHGREDCGSWLAQDFFDDKSSDGRTLAEIFPSIRWVFPTAKRRFSAKRHYEFSITSFAHLIEDEEIISQWFDIWDVRDPESKKELMQPGLQESISQIIDIIMEEAQTVPLERIILGGLSQGCATAILTLLYSGLNLGGFIGWCGWLPYQKSIEELNAGCIGDKHKISRGIQSILQIFPEQSDMDLEPNTPDSEDSKIEARVGTTYTVKDVEINHQEISLSASSIPSQSVTKTPVFFGHSQDDDIVPFELGNDLRQIINKLGFDVTWKKYEDKGHQIHPVHGVDDMCLFLQRVMKI